MNLIKFWIFAFVSVALILQGYCIPNPEDHGMKTSRVEIITVTSGDGETSKTKQIRKEFKTGVSSDEEDEDFFDFGDDEKTSSKDDKDDKNAPEDKDIDGGGPESDESGKDKPFKVDIDDLTQQMLTAMNSLRADKKDKKIQPLVRSDKMSEDAGKCCDFYAKKNQVVECPDFTPTAFCAFSTSRTDESNKEVLASAMKMWKKSGVLNNALLPQMHDIGCSMTRSKDKGTHLLLFIAEKKP